MHHVYDPEALRAAFWKLKKDAALGVGNLKDNLQDLSPRLKQGGYQAKPVRRMYIPRANGRQGPLGVTALEDKIVQRAAVEVLNATGVWTLHSQRPEESRRRETGDVQLYGIHAYLREDEKGRVRDRTADHPQAHRLDGLMKIATPFLSLTLTLALLFVLPVAAQDYPAPRQGDFEIKDYRFKSGEVLPNLKLHYATLGKTAVDATGKVTNAVLILHGTGGTGGQFLNSRFAGVLFGPGKLLDAGKYFIVLPDNIGHGHSSKPSDGLHAKFPHYDYDDMVALQHQLLTDGLKVNHLRLILGTSMGCMHSWVWGETYPDFADALMPLACNPVQIAGRNRILRKMIIDAIRNDPGWMKGEYVSQPRGMVTASDLLVIMGSSALQMQKNYSTRDLADAEVETFTKEYSRTLDANDFLYQIESSRNYDPSPKLEQIKVPVMAVNSADDVINPPELGILEREIKRVRQGKAVILPITDQTRGHGTHTLAAIWENYLADLLQRSTQKRSAQKPPHVP